MWWKKRLLISRIIRRLWRIHGRRNGVILALGNGVSVVVSGLGSMRLSAGDRVEAGAPLGRAADQGIAVALYLGDRAVATRERF